MSYRDFEELEQFKRAIDLRAYAAGQGFELDRQESWRGSAVMRHPVSGDKIVVKRNPNGHYVFFSVRDDDFHGTIVDFVQRRQRVGLGAVRTALRSWIVKPPVSIPAFPALPPVPKDRLRVETEYAKMRDGGAHPYLKSERALPAALLQSTRFAGRVRMDRRENAVFPHFDRAGLCGYEIKNSGFTSFSPGGSKGLWFSHVRRADQRAVFCESAIDALSYAVLFPDELTRYASIGGKPSPLQPELIQAAVERMAEGSEVVAAMDADTEGAKLAELVRLAVEVTGRKDLRFTVRVPVGCKDWNDQLRKVPNNSFPIARSACVLNP